MSTGPRHQCLIYDGSPSEKLTVLAAAIRDKLSQGYRCLYLNSAPMITGLRSYLSALGVDVAQEVGASRLVLSSDPIAQDASGFDSDAMLLKLEDAIDEALKDGYKGLWASGDIAWEFGHERNLSKLLEYEQKLEELFARRPELCGICQYHKDSLPADAMRQGLITHKSNFINETLSRINPFYMRPGTVTAEKVADSELDEMIDTLCKPV